VQHCLVGSEMCIRDSLYSMRQFRSNQATGRDTIMAASLYGMSDDDLKAIAHYLSQLK
jgi:cytochrome c553